MDRRTTAAYVLSAGLIAATGAGTLVATRPPAPRRAPNPPRCATSSRPPSSPASSTWSIPLPRSRPPLAPRMPDPVSRRGPPPPGHRQPHPLRRHRRRRPSRTRRVSHPGRARPGRSRAHGDLRAGDDRGTEPEDPEGEHEAERETENRRSGAEDERERRTTEVAGTDRDERRPRKRRRTHRAAASRVLAAGISTLLTLGIVAVLQRHDTSGAAPAPPPVTQVVVDPPRTVVAWSCAITAPAYDRGAPGRVRRGDHDRKRVGPTVGIGCCSAGPGLAGGWAVLRRARAVCRAGYGRTPAPAATPAPTFAPAPPPTSPPTTVSSASHP